MGHHLLKRSTKNRWSCWRVEEINVEVIFRACLQYHTIECHDEALPPQNGSNIALIVQCWVPADRFYTNSILGDGTHGVGAVCLTASQTCHHCHHYSVKHQSAHHNVSWQLKNILLPINIWAPEDTKTDYNKYGFQYCLQYIVKIYDSRMIFVKTGNYRTPPRTPKNCRKHVRTKQGFPI